MGMIHTRRLAQRLTLSGLASLTVWLAAGNLSAEVLLYSESFTDDNGKGMFGDDNDNGVNPGAIITNLTGVDWTVQAHPDVGINLKSSTDYIGVINGELQARDLDGRAIWRSPEVSIAFYEDLELTFTADGKEGRYENIAVGGGDMYRVTLIVDGDRLATPSYDPQFRIVYGGGNSDRFNPDPNTPISLTGFSGLTVQIEVEFQNQAGDEIFVLDDLRITGTPTPEPASLAICLLASAALLGRRP